ncbi:MAG: metal-dependent transcriptional regulator [Actinobacteria bacterium]|nr:metal-dependent transcriptional regulator [Actinomycetota bacterium]
MARILSQSLEDYLEAIYIINLDNKVVRVKEVAVFLDVKTPSVVDAVSKLTESGLVNHEKYGYLELTAEGKKFAGRIYLKHEKIYKFFRDVLIVSEEISKKDACKIEHYISKETMDHMIKFIRFIESCPDEYPEWLKHFKYFIEHGKRPEECRKK